MRLVDSSAWIEWLADGALAPRLEAEFPLPGTCVVPTIVQLEVSKWLFRERTKEEASAFVAYSRECVVVDLTTTIAVGAAEMGLSRKLAIADAIIYATAIETDSDLLTCDAHFKGLPGVVYLEKPA